MSRRDLLDRAQPQDAEKSPDLAEQEHAGFRPETPPGTSASERPHDANAAKTTGETATDEQRRRLNPKRDPARFRPRDEGGATPSRGGGRR